MNHLKQILLIEDDPILAELIVIHLRTLPGELTVTRFGREGLHHLLQRSFDCCILDLMLPDISGFDVCRQIRLQNSALPILMLTARSQERDKVAGLEAGADDYLTKPFGVGELLARVRALLRRSDLMHRESIVKPPSESRVFGALIIDEAKRFVTMHGQRVDLTPKEFDLLLLLATEPGKTYSRKELLNLVWGYKVDGYEHTVTTHINRLRGKIEPDFNQPSYILTTWGIGYRFTEASRQDIHDTQPS